MSIVFEEMINQIKPLDYDAMNKAKNHWDSIGKPLGSLGRLEEAVITLAGIQGNVKVSVAKRALVIMCADNGVVEEGVTQTGMEVTAIVAENFLDNKTCVALMCEQTATDIFPIDIGMAVDTPRVEKKKIAYGTANMSKGPAMTREQAILAIEVGINNVKELKKAGYSLIATGEMGIGNTTTSSAITSVMLNLPVSQVTGRGAGLSSEGLERKINVIEKAISLNKPDLEDPIDVLSKVGGFDIAGLVGLFLGGAIYGVAVIIDGFISAVAALIATRLAPGASDYIIASHSSSEPAVKFLLEALGKKPFLTCDMHLGEGSGAVAIMPLLDMAVNIYDKMGTFDDINVTAYRELL